MTFLFALCSAFGYALQNALMTKMYRKLDGLSASCYRGLTLGISMSPLLLLTSPPAVSVPPAGMYAELLAAAILAGIANCIGALLFRLYPIGVANALCQGTFVAATTVLGIVFFSEQLSTMQYLCIMLITAGSVLLAFESGKGLRLSTGILALVVYGFALGGGFAYVGSLSRRVDPFFVAWAWELSIGVVLAVIGWGRFRLTGQAMAQISKADAGRILLYCSPTAIGTAGFALAPRDLPLGIVSAIGSTQLVFAAILAAIFSREMLSHRQLGLALLVLVAVVALRFV